MWRITLEESYMTARRVLLGFMKPILHIPGVVSLRFFVAIIMMRLLCGIAKRALEHDLATTQTIL